MMETFNKKTCIKLQKQLSFKAFLDFMMFCIKVKEKENNNGDYVGIQIYTCGLRISLYQGCSHDRKGGREGVFFFFVYYLFVAVGKQL